MNGSDHPYCLTHRNFAVLDPSDGHGKWDRNGNLWVRYHTELGGGTVLEQLLPRAHG